MGDRIHDLRSYLGLSLKAFGEAIGFSGNHISRFEKNVFSPDERVIQKICDVFHVDPAYFTGEMPVEQAVQKVEVDTAGAGEYSRAVTPQIRQAGNRMSGLAETAYASLLAQCFV